MTNDVAIVVGVGPGLGSAIVRRAAAAGLTVLAAARSATKLEGLKSGPDADRIHLRDCDATTPEGVSALFREADKLGRVDLAVFNAGAFARGTVTETDPGDFERCWRVGCFAGFLMGQEAARRMSAAGRGTIIFTGATASLRGGAGFANLASPKFALRALAQSMARELGSRGVHVAHTIIDGQIRSDRYEHLLEERGPDSLLEPDAIADAYMALYRQPRSAWTFELDLRPWVEKF